MECLALPVKGANHKLTAFSESCGVCIRGNSKDVTHRKNFKSMGWILYKYFEAVLAICLGWTSTPRTTRTCGCTPVGLLLIMCSST